MDKGTCTLSYIPVRKEPSETSELVTQLLFGETYSILQKSGSWALIEMDYDNYQGWIDGKLIFPISQESYTQMKGQEITTSGKLLCTAQREDMNGLVYLLMGSDIYGLNDRSFMLGNIQHTLSFPLALESKGGLNEKVVFSALQLLNIPYLWGGRSSFGIDCSGLVQISYKTAGIKLPRDAYQQALIGETIASLNDVMPGDVAFFKNTDGKIIHTGLMVSPSKNCSFQWFCSHRRN